MRRMAPSVLPARNVGVLMVTLAWSLLASSGRAQAEQRALEQHEAGWGPAEIGLGADYRFAMADFCGRSFEVVACASTRSFVGGELSARWQMNEAWLLGPVMSMSAETGTRRGVLTGVPIAAAGSRTAAQTSQLATFGLEARTRPYGPGLWLAPRASVVILRDVNEEVRDGFVDASSGVIWGAELAGGIGYDWWVTPDIALVASGRFAYTLMATSDVVPDDGTRLLSSGVTLGVGLGSVFAFGG